MTNHARTSAFAALLLTLAGLTESAQARVSMQGQQPNEHIGTGVAANGTAQAVWNQVVQGIQANNAPLMTQQELLDLAAMVAGYGLAAANNQHDVVLQQVADRVAYIVTDFNFLYRGKINTANPRAFIDEQRVLEAHKNAAPGVYRERVVTVGFEHQFTKHRVANPDDDTVALGDRVARLPGCFEIADLDHLEVAETPATRINGVAFKLETDSGNELEFVSPPYLLRTVRHQIPLPDPDQVEAYTMMTYRALKGINETIRAQPANAPWNLTQLIQHFAANWGITFAAAANTVVEPSTITQNTPITQDLRTATNGGRYSITRQQMNSVCLAYKDAEQIEPESQINTTTDYIVYTAYKDLAFSKNGALRDPYYRMWWGILNRVIKPAWGAVANPGLPAPSRAMKAFLIELAGCAADQAVLPALTMYNQFATNRYNYANNNTRNTHNDKWVPLSVWDEYDEIEGVTSVVKNWTGAWLKTSLMDFGQAALPQGEWAQLPRLGPGFTQRLTAFVQDPNHAPLWGMLERIPAQQVSQSVTGFGQLFSQAVTAKIGQNVANMQWDGPFNLNGVRIQYTQHVPGFLGPRQDTYLTHAQTNGQLALIWPNRDLFVIEIREEYPHDVYRELAHKVRAAGGGAQAMLDAMVDDLYDQAAGTGVLTPALYK